jgi:hypothetical protein
MPLIFFTSTWIKFAWAFALVATHRGGVGGAVTAVEATAARGVKDRLHRRGRHAGFVRDVIGAPAMFAAQLQHLVGQLGIGPPR